MYIVYKRLHIKEIKNLPYKIYIKPSIWKNYDFI